MRFPYFALVLILIAEGTCFIASESVLHSDRRYVVVVAVPLGLEFDKKPKKGSKEEANKRRLEKAKAEGKLCIFFHLVR